MRRGRPQRRCMYSDKDIRNQDEQTTSIHPHSSSLIHQRWMQKLMWRKEKRVRRGNSWRPGGESASRREFVGVQNQQLQMRVYINSPSSPLLRLEQYLLKQYLAAPPTCQVCLPGHNWVEAFQSSTQKQKCMMGGGRQCAQIQMQGWWWSAVHGNKQISTHAHIHLGTHTDNFKFIQVYNFTHHGETNSCVGLSCNCRRLP